MQNARHLISYQFILTKVITIDATRCLDFSSKCTKIRLATGLRPDPRGSSQRSPKPQLDSRGPILLRGGRGMRPIFYPELGDRNPWTGGDLEVARVPPGCGWLMPMYSRQTSVSTQLGGRPTIVFSGDVSSTRQHSIIGARHWRRCHALRLRVDAYWTGSCAQCYQVLHCVIDQQ